MEETNEGIFERLRQKYPEYNGNMEEFQKNYPSLSEFIEFQERKVAEEKEREFIENNYVDNYHLKKYFSLLTEEEIQRQKEVDALRAKSFGLTNDTYAEMQKMSTKYFADVKVLLTYDYPYYSAYKIGNSIQDSEFIECSLYMNDIYKIIDIFLKTGEKLHDV